MIDGPANGIFKPEHTRAAMEHLRSALAGVDCEPFCEIDGFRRILRVGAKRPGRWVKFIEFEGPGPINIDDLIDEARKAAA